MADSLHTMKEKLTLKDHYDVIVIGAGIAGSVSAKLLAQKGYSVLLLEKDMFSGKTTACGGLFDRSYFDRHASDPGLVEQQIRKNVFHLPWGDVIFSCEQVTVKRRVYDRYLARQAQKAGAELCNGLRALDFTVHRPGEASVVVREISSGRQKTVRGKLLLFADGPHSLAHQKEPFARLVQKKYWAYAYAYEVQGVPIPNDEVHIYFAPQLFPWGYGWVFPNKQGSNVGVGTILAGTNLSTIKKKLFTFLRRFPPTAPMLAQREINDKKGGFIPMWMLKRLSAHSVLLLGDAAGMVSPLFGAGIDYAIDAAEAAAAVAERALRVARFDAAFLNTYDAEIERRFGKDLRKQMLLARIIIFSRKFGRLWPVKILAVIAFGVKYSRWNKIRILLYPLLGRPEVLDKGSEKFDHK